MNVIVTKKTVYKSIELSKQIIVVAGNDAIVRHAWESESGTGDGKWNVSKIRRAAGLAEAGHELEAARPSGVQGLKSPGD